MCRFSVYKRSNGIYYGSILNDVTENMLPARSTGTKDHDHALLVTMGWYRDGRYPGKTLSQALGADTAISAVRTAPWTSDNVDRLITAMKDRG